MTDEYRDKQIRRAGTFHCFGCNYVGNMPESITEILKARNIGQDGLAWLKENIPDFDDSGYDFETLLPTSELEEYLTALSAVNSLQAMQSKVGIQYVSEEELARYRHTVAYMYERGLTDEIIEKFDIGFDPLFIPPGRSKPLPCITFPIRDISGRTLFFCRRAIDVKFFNYPEGVDKPVYGIYELPKGCKSVLIAESCLNALSSWVFGQPAVALLGTGNSLQIEQLKRLGVQQYILAMDPDEAGQRATRKLKKALSSVAMVWTLEGFPEGKDLNDLDRSEFEKLRRV